MSKVAAKLAETLGLSGIAKRARTAADYDKLADAIRTELQVETNALADLDSQRETLLIDGGDERAFYERISRTHEREKTLMANLRAVERRRDERRAVEYTESLEAAARIIRERDVPILRERLRGVLDMAAALIEEAKGVGELEQTIAAANENAKGNNRRDLVTDVAVIRETLARELADFTPDEAPAQMPGESADAYALRAQNRASSEIDRLAQQNPFLLVAAAIKDEVLKILVPRDAHTASRNGVEVNVMNFVDRDGSPVKKIRNLAETGRVGASVSSSPAETSPREYDSTFVEPTVGIERDRTTLRGI